MKKIFLFFIWIFVFYLFLEFYFLFFYGHFLDYFFIEFITNYDFKEFDLIRSFDRWFVFFLVLSVFLVFLIKNQSKLTLFLIFLSLLVFIVWSGSVYTLFKGINYYKLIHKSAKNIVLKNNSDVRFVCSEKRCIAHAGGGINSDIYTNSLEALNNSYKNGFRLFELDIRKTLDNRLVAVHDWQMWKDQVGFIEKRLPTLDEFRGYKSKKYTFLDMDMINKWFLTHKDAILVTDKIDEPDLIKKRFVDSKRVMMELFSLDSIFLAKKLGIVAMPTWDRVVRLMVKNRTKLLKALQIEYVVAPYDNFIDPQYKLVFKKFAKNGIKVFLYGHYGKEIKPDYFYGRYIDDVTTLQNQKR